MFVNMLAWLGWLQARRKKSSKRKPQRPVTRLGVVVLEARVPVSEQIGPFLALSTLQAAGGLVSPPTLEGEQPVLKEDDSFATRFTSLLTLPDRFMPGVGPTGLFPTLTLPGPAAAPVGAWTPQQQSSVQPLGQELASLFILDFGFGDNIFPPSDAPTPVSAGPTLPSAAGPTDNSASAFGSGTATSPEQSTDNGSAVTLTPTLPADQSALEAMTVPITAASSHAPPPPPAALAPPPAPSPTPTSRRFLNRNHGRQPLSFEPNVGQVRNTQVQFLARGAGYTAFLGATETSLVLNKLVRPALAPLTAPATERAVLRLQLVGANPAARAVGVQELPTRSNYFLGNDRRAWRSAIPNYAQVLFRNVYNGIDLRHYGSGRQVEYDFIVRPGASPSQIRLAVQGTDSLSINPQGHLVLATAGGNVIHRAPVLYQLTAAGIRQTVAGSYALLGAGQVGLQIGAYDARRTLYIDPVLDYSDYLGGTGDDFVGPVVVDAQGNAYVTGQTTSPEIPPGGQPRIGGEWDAFVAKLDAAGNRVWVTYLGGTDDTTISTGNGEAGFGIAVDPAGNSYVVGRTNATDFSTTPGVVQPSNGFETGGSYLDAFVARLDATGGLRYSTYLGGAGAEEGAGIGIDLDGNAYVTGYTTSTNFPTAGTPYQSSRSGPSDAFVTKLNPTGTARLYSTYFGGAGGELGLGIAVDAGGAAYITGQTGSTVTFPQQPNPNPIQGSNRGLTDAFVAKLDSSQSSPSQQLVYSTFLGGQPGRPGTGHRAGPGQQRLRGRLDGIDKLQHDRGLL